MSEGKRANIHSDVFQALVALVAVCEREIHPGDCLREARFVVQEVLAGRMDFDTVTPYPSDNEDERTAAPLRNEQTVEGQRPGIAPLNATES